MSSIPRKVQGHSKSSKQQNPWPARERSRCRSNIVVMVGCRGVGRCGDIVPGRVELGRVGSISVKGPNEGLYFFFRVAPLILRS